MAVWRSILHLWIILWGSPIFTTVVMADTGIFENLAQDSPKTNTIFSPEQIEETIPDTIESPVHSTSTDPLPPEFILFPVGVNLGNRNVLPTTLIKGYEDGEYPIYFDQWRLSFEEVVKVLNVQVTIIDNGELELRSYAAVTQISPDRLTTDPDLGLVLSIGEIKSLLGISATFDMADYAIRFPPPEQHRQQATEPLPIVTEGLPALTSTPFSLSAIGQHTSISGRTATRDKPGSANFRGRFNAVGTAFGGAWYTEIEQPDLEEQSSWYLSELQYLRYGDNRDYALGSQPTFWQSQGNDYWGATVIQRWGFAPPAQRGSSGFNPRQRLQATNLGRTVSGEAEPGTLVQLARNNQVTDEVLVDASGLYRFSNVAATGSYRVLLFPNGQLTASPDEYEATFSSLPGQLPARASTLVVSAGFNRKRGDQFLGDFKEMRAGLGYRTGISESLTLGAGIVQDDSLRLLSELFYSPNQIPLKASVSTTVTPNDGEIDINADVRWQPTHDLGIQFHSDRFSQRLRASWQMSPNITLTASGSTRDDAVTLGSRMNLAWGKLYLVGQTTVDTNSNLRWNLNARYGALNLRHRGDEITTQSRLTYNLSDRPANSTGHSLTIRYETRNLNEFSQLGIVSWRYRSRDRNIDGRSLWDLELGYGLGTAGSGPIANLTTGILPGLDLRARYQGISAFSDQGTFRLELSPRLNLQQGLQLGSPRQDWLRTQGGLMIQPFLDNNNNGQQDPGENSYLDDLDLLVTINYESLDRYRPYIQNSYATVPLTPGLYRIDLDPAGFPLDRQAIARAFAVDVAPGEYTQLPIPLGPSFSASGVVMDTDGNAIGGTQVEAIHTTSDHRQLSVTNGAGVFYLEGMAPGDYRFEIDGQSVDNTILNFEAQTEPFQEINFQVFPQRIQSQITTLENNID